MKRKATILLIIAAGWLAAVLAFLFSGFGIGLPGWIPISMVIPIFAGFEVVLLLGWVAPAALGIRLLTKARHRNSPA